MFLENININLENIANSYINQARFAIKNKQIERKGKTLGLFKAPVNNTGRLADSLKIEKTEQGIRVTSIGYIHFLIYGRKPGKFAPVDKINEWCRSKGINNPYAVNLSLAQNGSTIWQAHLGKNSGLLSDIDISKEIKDLENNITNTLSFKILSLWQ